MSDDEYYDDEYADFHDMLYDADPDPDLADDLAEHAAHSPVYFDNPNEEARDYFSDWEYYSDDYFDDDPVLLSTISKDSAAEKTSFRNSRQSSKRGRKRKLSEVRDRPGPETKEIRALRACLQGTVWKAQSPELVEDYKGNSQPVALRLSKAIMRSAYSMKKGFGTGRSAKDESWANDLSLADMGLRTETSMDLQHASGTMNEEVVEEDEESVSVESGASQSMTVEEAHAPSNDSHLELLHHQPLKRKPPVEGQPNGLALQDSDNDRDQHQMKRRKVIASGSSTESKNSFNTPGTSLDSDQSDTAMEIESETQAVPQKRRRGRPRKQPLSTSTKATNHAAMTGASIDTPHIHQSSHTESTATASTASSRAKRITSSNTTSTSASTHRAGPSKVTKTTRKTRSQQK